MKRFLLSLLMTATLLAAPGCGLDDVLGDSNEGPYDGSLYEWVAEGNRMTFDFHPISDTLVGGNGFRYDATENVKTLKFNEVDTNTFRTLGQSKWDRIPRELNSGVFGEEYIRTAEGLKRQENRDCDSPVGGLVFFKFVRVPAEPEVGATHPQYYCGDDLEETLRVAAVGQTVEVAAGRFENVFVLRSSRDQRKEYWSEAEGILKIELYEGDGDLLGYYELASKNF
jgi:hypothetical protein